MTTARRIEPPTWRELLDTQDDVLSRRQALLGGLSEDAWQWRLDRGTWQGLLPGVAVAHSGTPTAKQVAWAAVLHGGRGVALSGDAALLELGMRALATDVIDLAVPEKRIVRAQSLLLPTADGVRWRLRPHRVRHLGDWLHPVRRPPVLRPAPAVLHAAAWAPSVRAAEWRVAAAVQQRLVTVGRLRSELASMPRLHRRALIATVLDDVELGAHARSELDFVSLLRRNGLPLPDRLQRPVRARGVRYLDAWWEKQRLAAEVDGAHHREAATWDSDGLRANDVVVAERHDRVLLLRFTTGNLRNDEAAVVRQLSLALC